MTADGDEAKRTAGGAWWLLALLAALWFSTLNQLRVEWSVNAQYAYGWTVPFLALYLFGERWKARPATAAVRSWKGLAVGAAVPGLMLLPLRVIQEGAPDWRLVSWAMAGVSLSLSLCVIYFAGGRPWLRHFVWPICFLLVAVPWPVPFEQGVIQRLTQAVATICVDALGWFGIPATQHGNVIEVSSGVVGVEEACSGVRSLQTTLMAALFLGELFRFGRARRAVLLGGGLVLAFVGNAGRAFFLVWLGVGQGAGVIAKWHDTVGLIVLVVSLGGLAVLTAALRVRRVVPDGMVPPDPLCQRPRMISRNLLIGGALWLLAVEGACELWYRAHESRTPRAEPWSVALPAQESGFRELRLPESTRAILRYNEARSATWADAGGRQWSLVFLRWFPGRAAAQLARSHGPEICLPASGAVLLSDLGLRRLQISKIDLVTHAYIFGIRERQMYVFYGLWEDQPSDDAPQSTRVRMTAASRLEDVWKGRRNLGQQMLEVAVAGPRDADEAEAEIVRLLGGVIHQARSANSPGGRTEQGATGIFPPREH